MVLELVAGDGVLYTIQDAVHDRDVVTIRLVVAEPVEAPALLGVHVHLDDAVVEGLPEALEDVPLGVLEVQRREVVVAAAAVVGEEVDGGRAVVVDEGLGDAVGALLVVGLDEGEFQLPDEVDRVLVGLLPLEDVGVGAGLVLAVEGGEDEAVVVVLEALDDLLEEHADAVGHLHGLEVDEEGLVLLLLGVVVQQLLVGPEDLLLEVAEALRELALHQRLTVQREAVEDEVPRLVPAVAEHVHDQLAVQDRAGVEGLRVARKGEV